MRTASPEAQQYSVAEPMVHVDRRGRMGSDDDCLVVIGLLGLVSWSFIICSWARA